MKVKVNRKLSEGQYRVNFEVGSFTPDELQKMDSFGVPLISLAWGGVGNQPRTSGQIALTQITAIYNASFNNEEDAKKYEATVLAQIRAAVERLRSSQDKFSSSEEVPL
jgi:hypothetical protein